MTHKEDLTQNFVIPDAALQEALLAHPAASPPPSQVEANLASNPIAENLSAEQEEPRNRRTLGSIVVGTATTGYLFLSGGQTASAASTETLAAQTANQGSDALTQYGPLALTALGLATTVFMAGRSMTRQSRDNKENRFNTAVQSLKGESSGEERVLRLAALNAYARSKEFAPSVFETAATYLRGRRSGLDILRKEHATDSDKFEHAVGERLNADREALKLLLKTLPAARKELGESRPSRVKRLMRTDDQHELNRLTGVPSPDHKPRVRARGINLDYMRDIKEYSFRDMDLTGAGMQGDQFKSVIFRNARLSEAQFEGSKLYLCDLRKTDARAAHWYGAEIKECVVDKNTQLGNLPDEHPDAKKGPVFDPQDPDGYRGTPKVILKDLIPAKGMTEDDLIAQIKGWQENGLVLLPGSNPEYFLHPPSKPNSSQTL